MYVEEEGLVNWLLDVPKAHVKMMDVLLVNWLLELDDRQVLVRQVVAPCQVNLIAKGQTEG